MYSYTGYSISRALIWKISSIRRFAGELRKQKSFTNLFLIKKTRLMRDSRSGPAMVCATGESLNACPEEFLDFFQKKKSLFGISHYLLSDLGKQYPPNFQVLIDESHFDPKFAKDKAELEFQKRLKTADIGNVIHRHVSRNPIENSNSIPIWGHALPGFTKNIDPTRTVGFMPNSSLFGIATALYLGYSPIFVVGLDYNYHAFLNLDENTAKLKRHHAYENDVKGVTLKGREKVSNLLGSVAWTIYTMKLLNIKGDVYTLGGSGSVDAFERISVENLASYIDNELQSS